MDLQNEGTCHTEHETGRSPQWSPIPGVRAGTSWRTFVGTLCVQIWVVSKVVIQGLPESGCWKTEQNPDIGGPEEGPPLLHLCIGSAPSTAEPSGWGPDGGNRAGESSGAQANWGDRGRGGTLSFPQWENTKTKHPQAQNKQWTCKLRRNPIKWVFMSETWSHKGEQRA